MMRQKITHLISSWIAYIMNGVMVFLFEKRHLERKNGKKFVNVTLNVFDTILFPSPDLWRNIIIDRNICLGFYIFCYLQIEAWIIDQNHAIWLPNSDITLTHAHITKNHWQVKKHGNEAHISQFTIMPDTCATD